MNFRVLMNQMKEPIYKDDLKKVILNGLLFSVLFGALAGALQFLLETFLNVTMVIFILILAYIIAKKINESFFTFHIIYPLISVVCFFVGFIIYNFTKVFFMFRDFINAIQFFFSLTGVKYVFGFFNVFNFTSIYTLYNLINTLIFLTSIVAAWQIVYRHR